MKYVDWVERVLVESSRAISADVNSRLVRVQVTALAKPLDLGIDPYGTPGFHESDERLAILEAAADLAYLGLADAKQDAYRVVLTDKGRKGHEVSLRTAWPQIVRGIRVDEEELAFLRRAAERSEDRREHFARMQYVTSEEIFADLGWPWEMGRALDITKRLKAKLCLDSIPTMGGPYPGKAELHRGCSRNRGAADGRSRATAGSPKRLGDNNPRVQAPGRPLDSR